MKSVGRGIFTLNNHSVHSLPNLLSSITANSTCPFQQRLLLMTFRHLLSFILLSISVATAQLPVTNGLVAHWDFQNDDLQAFYPLHIITD